jgi:hypothetical protein
LTLFSFFITSFCSFLLFSSTSYYFHSSSTSSLLLFSPCPHSYLSRLHSIPLWFFLHCFLILSVRISLLWFLFFFPILICLHVLHLSLSCFYLFFVSLLPLWLFLQLLFGSSSITST